MFGGKQWERKRRRYEPTCLIGLGFIIEYNAFIFFVYTFGPMARQTNLIVTPQRLHPYSWEDCKMSGSQFVSTRVILSVYLTGIYFVHFVWGFLPKEKTSLKNSVCVCVCACVRARNFACVCFLTMFMFVDRESSVIIATCYELDCPGIESRWGRDLLHRTGPTMGVNRPPVQWLPVHCSG
jgi:hypothetical protein